MMGHRMAGKRLAMVVVAAMLATAACGVKSGSGGERAGAGRPTATTAARGTTEPVGTEAPKTTTQPKVLSDGTFEGTGGAVLLRRSADATTATKTSKFAMNFAFSGGGAVPKFSFGADGAYDFEHKRARMTMDLGSLFATLGGQETAGSTIPPGGGNFEMIVDGSTAYIKADIFGRLLGTDKPWIKVSTDQAGGFTGGVGGGSESDPAQFLTFLRSVSGSIDEVGTEDVRGAATRHLRATIDLTKLADRAPAAEREKIRKLLTSLGEGDGKGGLPVDVWIDADNRVRRIQVRTDLSSAAGGSAPQGSLELTIEFFDFGAPVDVTPPPADQVIDARDLGLGSGSSPFGGTGARPGG